MNLGVIDLGTNTLRVLIEDNQKNVIYKKNFYLFLGNDVQEGQLIEAGKNKIIAKLKEIREIFQQNNVKKIFAVATAFARKINNVQVLKSIFQDYLDVDLRIIDSYTEGKIVLEAISNHFKIDNFMVIDMGGGSTELSIKRGNDCSVISIDMGSLSLKSQFFKKYPPSQEDKEAFHKKVIHILSITNIDLNNINDFYGVGGTITTIAFLLSGSNTYVPENINGQIIRREILESFCHKIEFLTKEDLLKIYPIEKGREEVLLSGSMFLTTLMYFFNINFIKASDVSLLEGIIPYFLKNPCH